jgi:hypothetical protein
MNSSRQRGRCSYTCDSGAIIRIRIRNEYLNLTNGQVEKGVSFSYFDDGFWTHAAHACAETTVEFENDEFVEECSTFSLTNGVIVDNLLGLWRLNAIPLTTIRL